MILKKFEKRLAVFGYFIKGPHVVNFRGDVVGSMNPYGGFESKDAKFLDALTKCMAVEEEEKPAKKAPAKKKRARTQKGKFIADDPSTPDVNEAWESDEG